MLFYVICLLIRSKGDFHFYKKKSINVNTDFFRENLFFANGVKRHIYDGKDSQLEHGLPIAVNCSLNSPVHKGHIFVNPR